MFIFMNVCDNFEIKWLKLKLTVKRNYVINF